MAIKKYAIIDHVGSIDERDLTIYRKVYKMSSKDGYDKTNCFTMKRFCQMNWNPYTSKVLDDVTLKRMKFAIRHQKNPEKVYFICPTLDWNAECEIQKWHERGVKVHVFEVYNNTDYDYEDFFDTHQFDWDGKASINRRLAQIWAPAFGYSFSAPITRIQHENNIENFTKRPDHDRLVEAGETHYSKPYTSSETFLEMNRTIATDAEIKEFRQYLDSYLTLTGCKIDTKVGASFGSASGNISMLQEFLNPDYIICESCNRPHKVHTGDCECPHCKHIIFGDFVLSPYYEDNNIDE